MENVSEPVPANRARIGTGYSRSRLLILGESPYSWENADGETEDPGLDHATVVAEWVIDAWDSDSITRFPACVTRALARKYDPNEQERRDAWDSCAFANYVTETVGFVGNRPRPEMWKRAEQPFLAMLETLKPSRIIVTGKELWDAMPPTAVHLCDDIQAYEMSDGALAWAMCSGQRRHLAWERLAKAIALFHSLNLPATMADFRRVIGESTL